MSEKAVQPCQDVSELLQTGEPVVLAVDQVPFEVESRGVRNTFCLLVPLMTDSGIGLNREEFHNRERVWWMLRPEISPLQIQVGTVWSGPIERSRAYGNPEKEKDHYQVRRADIRPGAQQFIEVLNLNVAHPDLSELLSPDGVPWPYPPLPRVVIRGGLSVVGPFRTDYNFETQRIRLKSLTDDEPQVHRMARAEFEDKLSIHEHSYEANNWDAKALGKLIELAFIEEHGADILKQEGEQLDGATDHQIVSWALDFVEIPENGRDIFQGVLEKANQLDGKADNTEFKERMGRFLKLCENHERVIELGANVASAISKRDAFKALVENHIETISRDRVDRAIAEKSSEISEKTSHAEGNLSEIQTRVDNLETEYATRRNAWEEEFRKEHGDREERLVELQETLDRQEIEMRERLSSLVKQYQEESNNVSERLIAQLPLMQKLGILNVGSSNGSARTLAGDSEHSDAPVALELPSYLAHTRERENIDEQLFLAQFRGTVDKYGFVFDDDDLINFHVLMKTGLWTVLAGASGLGKSSLPRFYAEALGCLDEYLLVPVRPDWLDDRDVIGAFNALSGRYEPAPCGLVDRLIAAQEDERKGRGGVYIICIDEMNLARVEHYFAAFLSVLEQPKEERYLNLFARGLAGSGDPYSRYRKLHLGNNIRMVGTVNVDETTHFFSPKVIDRVSIAHFERPELTQGLQDEDYLRESPPILPVHIDQYLEWVAAPDREGEAVDFLLKTEEILRRSRCGLGFRVRDRILKYVSSARHLLGEDRAIDMAFLQNVLPALRPIARRYMEMLKDLISLFPETRFRRTAQMLKALEEDPESDYFQLL